MREFDFGRVQAQRDWGALGCSAMRLQTPAADPDVLEPRLGHSASKGCIRIQATLNRFLVRRGLLDADYLGAIVRDKALWVLPVDRELVLWPGRCVVVVDCGASARAGPSLSPPARRAGAVTPLASGLVRSCCA